MYDGYQKYGANEAAGYEEARKREPLWQQEAAFVEDYFARLKPLSILDAPVGTGRFLENYAEAREVVGIDISEDMLRESARKIFDSRLTHIKLIRGDIFSLDFSDKHFDLTVCWRFAHLVPATLLANALRELGRVTRGEILLQTYIGPPNWRRVFASLFRLPVRIFKRFTGKMPPQPPWAHIRAYFHTQETMAASIKEAGLHIAQRIEIGRYEGSTVYVYRLVKPTIP